VHTTDDADHTAHLVRRTAPAEGIPARSAKPVLHGDNGATLKATTVLAMPHWLGIKPSYSRPRVSDDNAYKATPGRYPTSASTNHGTSRVLLLPVARRSPEE
jgi:transposase InsO family protein